MSNETPRCVITDEEIADPEEALKVYINRGETMDSHPFDKVPHLISLREGILDEWDIDVNELDVDHFTAIVTDTERVWVIVKNYDFNETTYHAPDSDDETAVALMELLNNEVLGE